MTEYQRRYPWKRTWPGETGLDGKLLEDYVCVIDGENTGRISYQEAGPMKGTWLWNGGHSRKIRATVLPHGGYAPSRAEAVRLVEEHYDRQREAAGLPPTEESI